MHISIEDDLIHLIPEIHAEYYQLEMLLIKIRNNNIGYSVEEEWGPIAKLTLKLKRNKDVSINTYVAINK